jgi:phosphoserine phosphatase RsbU/P
MPEQATKRSFSAQARNGWGGAQRFWDKLTEGSDLAQLWQQFHADARQSYALYSREVDWEEIRGQKPLRRWLHATWAVFYSLLMKLSPARRVLLLLATILVVAPLPVTLAGAQDIAAERMLAVGAGLLFVLLSLELADRVTMKRDLEIAREIQSWLVPGHPPAIAGAEVAFATRPANTVAGDYYDVLPWRHGDHDCWLIVVADVAGKSIPAALLMATFQASLHALLTATDTLADLVAGLNRYACDHSQGGRRFTTAFIAEYEPATRRLSYINAGHNAPVLKHGNGSIDHLPSSGLPLGIPAINGSAADYSESSLELLPDDTLVVFTDGLVEAVNYQGVEYGEERLLQALKFPIKETAALMLERLLAEVGRFVGETHQQDDITCLVFRCD